jgi:hypothetical protein
MTLDEANLIWNACYGSDPSDVAATVDAWQTYDWMQRTEAIRVRNQQGGQWGIWHISDRD